MGNPEHRRAQRKAVALRASVAHPDVGAPIAVRTLNLSKAGALVQAEEKLYPAEVCTFKFVTNDTHVVEIQGRVAWVTQDEAGLYRAGVAFRNLSPDEEYLLELQIVRSGTAHP